MIDFSNFIEIKTAFDTGTLSVENMQRTVKENYVSQDQYQTIVGEVYPVKTNKPHLLTEAEYAALIGAGDMASTKAEDVAKTQSLDNVSTGMFSAKKGS